MKLSAYINPLLHHVVFHETAALDSKAMDAAFEALMQALTAAEPAPETK